MVALASTLRASDLERSSGFLAFPFGEVPRGAFTEIAGPASSGRTTMLCSLLAAASAGQEYCALIDAQSTFDPESAARAGVRLSRVLWVRCGGNVEHALKAADWLAQGGGFGMVALDLAGTPVEISHRIPLTAWFRLRQAVINTKTVLVSVSRRVHAPSCSALKIELGRPQVSWRGSGQGRLLESITVTAGHVRNHRRSESPVTIPW